MKIHNIVAAVATLYTSALADTGNSPNVAMEYPFIIAAETDNNIAPIYMHVLYAAHDVFMINKDINFRCDAQPPTACPLTAFTLASASYPLQLDVEVPGGQGVYVSSDGALSFRPAGDLTPNPQVNNDWQLARDYLTYHGQGFYACDVDETKGTYSIYVEYEQTSTLEARACWHFQARVLLAKSFGVSGYAAYSYD